MTLVGRHGAADVESEAAAWGTACHEVSEMCLRGNQDAVEYIGRIVKTKAHQIEVDEELAETAQVYIDYVNERTAIACEQGGGCLLEQNFSLASLSPPFEAGGTSDAVLYFPVDELVEVVDLKGGRGVRVEAKANKQARTYGVGSVLTLAGKAITNVKVTIVQPRMEHPDGRIRSETISYLDLLDWTADLKEAWKRAHHAEIDYKGGATAGDPGDLQDWVAAYLSAGDHCQFCPAAGFCPALAEKSEREAQAFFRDEETGVAVLKTELRPDKLSPAQLARVLDNADMVQNWLNACRAWAQREAESGVEIPGYQLVERHGREKWTDDDAAAQARATCELFGVAEDAYQIAPKLRTPKQVRKALGKHGSLIDGLSTVPRTGTSLVSVEKTTRPAIEPPVNKFFTPVEDEPAANAFFDAVDD
jgi:hypothetical protein